MSYLFNKAYFNFMEKERVSLEEWEHLTREEKQQAILEFREPENIYLPKQCELKDPGRFL